MDQQSGSLHVARLVEHEHALVSVTLDLEDFDPKVPAALLPLLVAKDHRLAGREVPEPRTPLAGVDRNLAPGFLGSRRPRSHGYA